MLETTRPHSRTIAILVGSLIVITLVAGYVGSDRDRQSSVSQTSPVPAVTASATLQPITPIPVTTSLAFRRTEEMAPAFVSTDDMEPAPARAVATADQADAGVHVNVAPGAAAPGSIVTVAGSGFEPSEVINLRIAGGETPVEVLAGSDEAGTFETMYQVPDDSPLGYYSVDVLGTSSERHATARLLIAEGPSPTPIVIRIETALATTTPQSPDADATPVPLYSVVDTRAGVDCGWYGFFGKVTNPDGEPREGIAIRVYHENDDQTVITGRAESNDDGYWEVSLGNSRAQELDGLWHLVVIEEEQRGSAEIAVELAGDCETGRPTKFKVDWQRSVQ